MEIRAAFVQLWNQYLGLPRRLRWLVVAQVVLATLPAAARLLDGLTATILMTGSIVEVTIVLAFWAGMVAEWPDQAVVGVAVATTYVALCATIGFTGYSPVQNSGPAEQVLSWVYHTASQIVGTLLLGLVFLYIRRHVARLELVGQQQPGTPWRLPRKAVVGLIGLGVIVALLGLGVALTKGDNHWLLAIFFMMLLLYAGPPAVVLALIAVALAPGRASLRVVLVLAVAMLTATAFVLTDHSVTKQAFDPADLLPFAFACVPLGLLFATLGAIRSSGYRLVRV